VKEKPNDNATEKIARGTNQEGMGTLIQIIKGDKHSQRTARICTGKITKRDTSKGMCLHSGKALLDSYSGGS
jgi:hypothetical protein